MIAWADDTAVFYLGAIGFLLVLVIPLIAIVLTLDDIMEHSDLRQVLLRNVGLWTLAVAAALAIMWAIV